MRPLPRLAALCALLLGGCTTMLMHDKVNRMSGLSERTRTETLRYMGLDKDQRLVLIGSRHHFVLEAGTKERPYHARILAKLNRWTRQYPEEAARIYSVSLEDENQAFTSLNWTIRQPEILRDLQSEADCPCIRLPRDGGGTQIRRRAGHAVHRRAGHHYPAGSNPCHDTADAQIVVPVTENRPSENQAGRIPWQTPKSIRPTSFPRRRESWRKFGNGLFLHKLSNTKQDSRLRGNDGRG